MTETSACHFCGENHGGRCPAVKSIEYFPSGKIKRVEFVQFGVPIPQLPPAQPWDWSRPFPAFPSHGQPID